MDPQKSLPSPAWLDCNSATRPPQPQTLDSRHLFAAGREVHITHAGERYRLSLTRQNRLILTK